MTTTWARELVQWVIYLRAGYADMIGAADEPTRISTSSNRSGNRATARWVTPRVIVNVLRLTLKNDISDDERAEVLAALRRTASVESVSFSTVGEEFTDPSGRTIGYVVGVADLEALQRYMHDPVHLAGDDVILPRVARVSSIRFADTPIAEQVYALHEAKVANYPEWGRRLEEIFVD